MPLMTQLHDYHASHAKLVEFAGYEMPLWYSTTTEEHIAVRKDCGIFDVSHMGRFAVKGKDAPRFLEGLVPTRVQDQPNGKAFYTLFLNDRGGIMDDLIIMRRADSEFVVVVNAANAQTDMMHIRKHAPAAVDIEDITDSTVMIAVQGPKAAEVLQPLTPIELSQIKRFRFAETKISGQPALVSRTGYTGEDGFEIIFYGVTRQRQEYALSMWEKLAAASVPCGLGARDSLRLEAGLPLHGSDIDQQTDPFQADLTWVISAGKEDYVGSEAVARLKDSDPKMIRRGLVLAKGIPRHGFEVLDENATPIGTVTSGTFSPLSKRGIALCRVKTDRSGVGTGVKVAVRDSVEYGILEKPPFYDEKQYGWKRTTQH